MNTNNNDHRRGYFDRGRPSGDHRSYRSNRRSASRSPPSGPKSAYGPTAPPAASRDERWSSSSSSGSYRRSSRSRSRERDGRKRDWRDRSRSRSRSRGCGGERNRHEYSPGRSSRSSRDDRHNRQQPQIEVMLSGVPPFCQEYDIMDAIRPFSSAVDQVHITGDRRPGESKGLAYVRFATIKDAEDFMTRSRSALTIGGVHIRASYHHPRGPNNGASRICMMCGAHNDQYSQACWQCHTSIQAGGHQQQPRPMEQSQPQYQGTRGSHHSAPQNDGSRDIGQMPNSLLVAIDLPTTATETTLWEAFCELGGVQLLPLRIFLARDQRSRSSCGFGFIEYPAVEGAVMVLQRAGATFKVLSKTVGLYFAHPDSFYPAMEGARWVIPMGKEGRPMMYWDEQVQMTPFSAAEYGAALLNSQAHLSAAVTPIDPAQAHQQQSQPRVNNPPVQDLPAVPTAAKVDKAHLEGIAAAQAAEQLAKAEEKKRKKEAAHFGTKKISIQLQKWNTKQVELKMEESETPASVSTGSVPLTDHGHPQRAQPSHDETPTAAQASTDEVVVDTDNYDPDELEDVELMACMLCQRRFKGLPELKKHQELSELHKKNLQDKGAIRTALIKTRTKRGVDLATGKSINDSSGAHEKGEEGGEPKYRDRAAERRMVYGQPDNPYPPRHGGAANSRGNRGMGLSSSSSSSITTAIVPEQPTKDGLKEDNIGNRLLKSMGWKEGQGLGKDGGGITVPVEAISYSRGVGIGAGVLLKGDQHTRGYAETAKEIARRRYEEDR
ncbi:hypothetical protein BGW42_004395 [Actinomortierella wolfii]|nr:hypothetical protein BGW42_004395 [Actinomortierella wolfii]